MTSSFDPVCDLHCIATGGDKLVKQGVELIPSESILDNVLLRFNSFLSFAKADPLKSYAATNRTNNPSEIRTNIFMRLSPLKPENTRHTQDTTCTIY